MRFLVTCKTKFPMPPEAAAGLADAMVGWSEKYLKEKKMEQVWGFAGVWGGGGILNVNSAEELDAIMIEFPFGPFVDIECYVLSDLKMAMSNMKKAVAAMAPKGR
ncbi:MAG: hypothetical protein HY673_18770 [Chloroflexi bacterium]|nr:hypothetical protein [Chloroflexota bacterium]